MNRTRTKMNDDNIGEWDERTIKSSNVIVVLQVLNKDEDPTIIVDINENDNADTNIYTNTNTDAILLNDNDGKCESDDQTGIGKLTV